MRREGVEIGQARAARGAKYRLQLIYAGSLTPVEHRKTLRFPLIEELPNAEITAIML